jgi:ElaB/YqjD/DUF883 family membrane-anchored ribosome-binding protein
MATTARKTRAKSTVDLESELDTLREDLSRMTDQLTQFATQKGRDAVEAVRGAAENVTDTVEESIQERPMTTIALAVGLGFLIGAIWRR